MYGGPHARRPGLGRSAVALAIREGASMRAKVCSVAEDAGVLMQAVVGGRTFFGMVREVLPAPLSDLHAPPGGSAAAAAAAAEGTLPRRRHQPKVVVIGAGFAGLAAAEELHAMGCKVRPPPLSTRSARTSSSAPRRDFSARASIPGNLQRLFPPAQSLAPYFRTWQLLSGRGAPQVVVLEARARIGGRCWTHEADDLPAPESGEKLPLVGRCVDLGAAWIHGVVGNPLAELARQQGVELYQAPSDMVIHGADGQPVPAEDDQEMERVFNELLCQARDAGAAGAADESLGHVLDRLLEAQGAAHTPAQRQVLPRLAALSLLG
jgi:hypothetical protein